MEAEKRASEQRGALIARQIDSIRFVSPQDRHGVLLFKYLFFFLSGD